MLFAKSKAKQINHYTSYTLPEQGRSSLRTIRSIAATQQL